jgi:hypothetical protein
MSKYEPRFNTWYAADGDRSFRITGSGIWRGCERHRYTALFPAGPQLFYPDWTGDLPAPRTIDMTPVT